MRGKADIHTWTDGLRKNPVGPRRGAVWESDARSHTRRKIEYATIRFVSAVCRLGVTVKITGGPHRRSARAIDKGCGQAPNRSF